MGESIVITNCLYIAYILDINIHYHVLPVCFLPVMFHHLPVLEMFEVVVFVLKENSPLPLFLFPLRYLLCPCQRLEEPLGCIIVSRERILLTPVDQLERYGVLFVDERKLFTFRFLKQIMTKISVTCSIYKDKRTPTGILCG